MDETTLALLIPIIAIIMGCGVPMVVMLLEYLKKRHLHSLIHKERIAAIEKGMEAPPWPEGLFRKVEDNLHPRRYLRRGLIWLFVGITVGVAMFAAGRGPAKNAVFALIPVGVGLANLLYYKIEGKREAEEWVKARDQAALDRESAKTSSCSA